MFSSARRFALVVPVLAMLAGCSSPDPTSTSLVGDPEVAKELQVLAGDLDVAVAPVTASIVALLPPSSAPIARFGWRTCAEGAMVAGSPVALRCAVQSGEIVSVAGDVDAAALFADIDAALAEAGWSSDACTTAGCDPKVRSLSAVWRDYQVFVGQRPDRYAAADQPDYGPQFMPGATYVRSNDPDSSDRLLVGLTGSFTLQRSSTLAGLLTDPAGQPTTEAELAAQIADHPFALTVALDSSRHWD
jgi:hypothetical protein